MCVRWIKSWRRKFGIASRRLKKALIKKKKGSKVGFLHFSNPLFIRTISNGTFKGKTIQ